MKTIAHIDDDIFERSMVAYAASAVKGVELFQFASVEDYLDFNRKFDVLFVDLNIPPHYGVEVVEQTINTADKVYVFSGIGNKNIDEMREIFKGMGAVDFISKDNVHSENDFAEILRSVS